MCEIEKFERRYQQTKRLVDNYKRKRECIEQDEKLIDDLQTQLSELRQRRDKNERKAADILQLLENENEPKHVDRRSPTFAGEPAIDLPEDDDGRIEYPQTFHKHYRNIIKLGPSSRWTVIRCKLCGSNTPQRSPTEFFDGFDGLWSHITNAHRLKKTDKNPLPEVSIMESVEDSDLDLIHNNQAPILKPILHCMGFKYCSGCDIHGRSQQTIATTQSNTRREDSSKSPKRLKSGSECHRSASTNAPQPVTWRGLLGKLPIGESSARGPATNENIQVTPRSTVFSEAANQGDRRRTRSVRESSEVFDNLLEPFSRSSVDENEDDHLSPPAAMAHYYDDV